MAKLSVREAARRFDVSHPTMVKHIKSGKISAETTGGNGWVIDPEEMIRAGYAARVGAGFAPDNEPGKIAGFTAIDLPALQARLADMQTRLAIAEALAEERAGHIEDLRRMLPRPDAKPRRRWWQF